MILTFYSLCAVAAYVLLACAVWFVTWLLRLVIHRGRK